MDEIQEEEEEHKDNAVDVEIDEKELIEIENDDIEEGIDDEEEEEEDIWFDLTPGMIE